MVSQTVLFDLSTTLSKNEYQITGYTFNGWNTKPDGSGNAYPELASFTMKTEGATLYTVWTPNTYTVTFDGNTNTDGSTANQIFIYDTPQFLTAKGFTKSGYAFIGWNSFADRSGIAYADENNVNNLTATNNSTLSLYAQWEIREYTITYNLDNGSNDLANPTSYTVESADITLAGASKEGYTFMGW